jgi:DNA-binding CsgD family transcriptional regulator
VAKGFSFPETARLLGISSHTVTTHVRHIYEKLEVGSRASAVYEAVQLGLIRLDS